MLERGRRLSDEVGNDFGSGIALALLGVILGLSDSTAARKSLERSLERFDRIRDEWGVGFAHMALGRVLVDAREFEEAAKVLDEGVERLRDVGEKALLSLAMFMQGWALLGLGHTREATRVLVDALETVQHVRTRHTAARILEVLAAAANAAGDPERGARLFGAAEEARRSISAGVWVPDLETHDETGAALRAALGHERFRALWEQGLRLSVTEALALAGEMVQADERADAGHA
jgi:non-specific serine/threonine protein kinase